MKLKILIIGLLAMASLNSLAQTTEIVYTYDDAGNRETRVYNVIPAQAPAQAPAEEAIVDNTNANTKNEEVKPEVYEDLLGEQQIKVFPNPTRGKLAIEIVNYNFNETGTIQVFDMGGRLVQNITKLNQTMEVDITNEPAGTYIMVIVIGKEKSEWKIIKN
jgi:hypothetical protein